MQEELTTKMHSEFTIDAETEISHRVSCVVMDLKDGIPFNESLSDYEVSKEQYEKYRTLWEKLLK